MEKAKYETRKAKSLDMLKSGVEPIKNGFNEYFIPGIPANAPTTKREIFVSIFCF